MNQPLIDSCNVALSDSFDLFDRTAALIALTGNGAALKSAPKTCPVSAIISTARSDDRILYA
jgi:hypothetical protein